MNEQQIKGKFKEFKGEIIRAWGKITDNEMDETKGNLASIAGLIQQKYGTAKEEVMKKLNELGTRFNLNKDETVDSSKSYVDSAKTYAAKTTEEVKETLRDSKKAS